MRLPTLYKQNNTGKIQLWFVEVEDNLVTCTYGQLDGKLQSTTDHIMGKNQGKKNETTPVEQAQLKAQQLFDKKVKEGYVEDLELAKSNKNNLAAVEPMLAHPIEKKQNAVNFPAFLQPKLDGLRCIAVVEGGKCRLYSRTQKEFTTLPHIVAEIERVFGRQDIILDGELYNHDFKHDFERIVSVIKRNDVHEDHEKIQYHIYDVVDQDIYLERTKSMRRDLRAASPKFLKEVYTGIVEDSQHVNTLTQEFVKLGYEGAIFRDANTIYEHKRSVSLLKIKFFEDAEFKVVDVIEGNGKLRGTAGAIVVEDPENPDIKFKAKLKRLEDALGNPVEDKDAFQARCAYWLVNKEAHLGKMLTVKFQGRTNKGVPRFPIGMRLRDE